MAGNKDPKALAEKFVRRTQAASQDMVNGVNAVTINPAQQAIAKEQKLIANWNEAVQNGSWRKGMQSVTLEGWKDAMIKKGAPRVAAGVQAAQGKMEQFYAELIPFQDALNAKLANMPDLTIEDSINKAVAWMRGMSQFKRRGS